jgi:hypothetical protein
MITVQITYCNKLTNTLEYKSFALALEKVRAVLDVGDSYRIYEDDVLLAKGTIEEYKGYL